MFEEREYAAVVWVVYWKDPIECWAYFINRETERMYLMQVLNSNRVELNI